MSTQRCTQCGEEQAPEARFCPRCGNAIVAPADPLIGKIIADRYLISERIGQGASGSIYRAEHTTLQRKLAIKVLQLELSRDEAAVERFRREATTVGQIDNDHLVQVVDFGRTADQRLFFAMELLSGEPLDAALVNGPFTPERTIKILLQIGDALVEAHALGYLHRDLRPRNVFLSVRREERDFVKLLDFGLAKLIRPDVESRQTALGMSFGDPRYMSPEQARGDVLDLRSDIFSLGIVSFEMLTGKPPFAGANAIDVLQQMLDTPIPRVIEQRRDCPPWLDAVIARALEKDPNRRFPTVAAFMECLRAAQAPAEIIEDVVTEPMRVQAPAPVPTPIPRPAPNAATRTLIMPTALPASIAAAAPAPEPSPPASEPIGSEAVAEAESTNPGHRGALREPVEPVASTTMAETVSGELSAHQRSEPVSAGPPSATIVVEEGMRGEPTGQQPTTEVAPMLVVRDEPTGPHRAEGDDGWFSERAAPVGEEIFEEEPSSRMRAPVLIAVIAGVLSLGAIGTILLWPRGNATSPRVEPVAAKPPPTPTVTPIPTTAPIPTPPPVVEKPAPPPVVEKPAPLPVVEKPKPLPEKPKPTPVVAKPTPDRPKPAVAKVELPSKPRSSDLYTPKGFHDPFASNSAPAGGADVFVKTGRQKLAAGDLSSAQTAFSKARELDTHNAEAYAGLGEVAFEQGDYLSATVQLKQALRISPNRARFLVLLGESYYKLGRAKDAVQEYRHALRVDPTNQEAQHSLDLAEKKLAQGG